MCMSSCVFILLDDLFGGTDSATYTIVNNSTEGIYYSFECVEDEGVVPAEDVFKQVEVIAFTSVLSGETVKKSYYETLNIKDPESQIFDFFVFNRKTILYNNEKDIIENCRYDTCYVYSLKDLMQMNHQIVHNGKEQDKQ